MILCSRWFASAHLLWRWTNFLNPFQQNSLSPFHVIAVPIFKNWLFIYTICTCFSNRTLMVHASNHSNVFVYILEIYSSPHFSHLLFFILQNVLQVKKYSDFWSNNASNFAFHPGDVNRVNQYKI